MDACACECACEYVYVYICVACHSIRPARAHAVLSGTCNRFVGSRTVGLLEVKTNLPTSLYSGQHFSTRFATGNTNHLNGTSYTSVA